jgi:hypothetical protein
VSIGPSERPHHNNSASASVPMGDSSFSPSLHGGLTGLAATMAGSDSHIGGAVLHEALNDMLLAWYQSGYATARYEVQVQTLLRHL